MPEPFPENITIGEKYGPAMSVQTEEEARAYLERCVVHSMTKWGKTKTAPRQAVAKQLY